MSFQRKTALVAGGGIAGLSSAVHLDELGFRVTLVEKKPVLGGRAFSFTDKKTGAILDNGQHLLAGAYHETLSLLERIGAKSKVAFQIPTVVPLFDRRFRKSLFRLNDFSPPLGLAMALAGFGGLSLKDKFGFLKLGNALKKIASGKIPLPKNQTTHAWLEAHGQTQNAIRDFWEILTLATLNDSCERASADALATVLVKSYFSGRRDGFLVFPKTGLSDAFAAPARAYLEARGNEIRTNVGLNAVRILDGLVREAVLDDGSRLKPDVVVCALPPKRFLSVLPQAFVTATPKLQPLGHWAYAPIASVNLFFDREVMTDTFAGSSNTTVHWFFNRNRIHAANKNHHHVVGVVSGAYNLLGKSRQELVALARSDLERLYPQTRYATLMHALANIEREATLSCAIGVNAQRIAAEILPNLFVAGDWTATGLPPTIESAALSGKLAAEAAQRSWESQSAASLAK